MKKIIFTAVLIALFTTVNAAEGNKVQSYSLIVTEKGFEPQNLKVKSNTEINLKVTRKTDSTCAREMIIPDKKIKVSLPLNKEVIVNVGKLNKGEIKFGCAMNMMVSAVMIAE